MQTKWQKAYGIRRTWANKLERYAQAIREGDWDRARKLDVENVQWAERKLKELTEA